MPDYSTILYSLKDNLLTLTINRPTRLNALNVTLIEELSAAIDQGLGDGARCLLLTGAGKAFSSGFDLFEAPERAKKFPNENLMDSHFNPFVRKLSELPIPIVTAINGAAAGGGCALALAGDIMIAARSAYLLCAFVNIGLVPDMGATWLIAKSAGRATALEMMMLGERMPAEEALKRGVISRVVDDAALAAEAQKVAQRLAHGPTITLGLIRRQVTDSLAGAFDDTLRAEARHQQIASRTSDAHESQQAFREKRPARFTGA